jgi:hypothetical protein
MALGRVDNKSCLPGGKTPKFDIFAGHSGSNDVLWLETVEGLAAARSRMEEIAAQKPGPYFVFFTSDHSVSASIDTSRLMHASERSSAQGAA